MHQKRPHKDKLSKEERSRLMAKVGPKNTRPEIIVRKILFSKGYRYRLHKRGLPGSPDIVFTSRKKAIFVHGCFWHRHEGCKLTATPSTRKEFWQSKFEANLNRDKRNIQDLENLGWKTLVIWGCEVKNTEELEVTLYNFLENA